MDTLVRWFLRVWLTFLTLALLWWLVRHPLALAVIVALAAWGGVSWKREQQRRMREGYWIEWLTPGRVRDGPDDAALVYHEGEREYGLPAKERIDGDGAKLYVPSPARWNEAAPEWARDRRDEIIGRVEAWLRRHPGYRDTILVEQ